MRKHIVYEFLNLINQKKYYGVSGNFKKRYIQHCRSKKPLGYAIRKYGEENFQTRIVFEGTAAECYEQEPIFIKENKSLLSEHGYNDSKGGRGGAYGVKRSKETKMKMSESRKLVKMPPVSEAAKVKHAENMRKRMQDPEYRAKANPLGRKHEKGTKEIMSEKRSAYLATLSAEEKSNQTAAGRQKSLESRTKTYKVISPKGEIFIVKNLKQFSKDHGIDDSSMFKVARGKNSNHKNWICSVVNTIEQQ